MRNILSVGAALLLCTGVGCKKDGEGAKPDEAPTAPMATETGHEPGETPDTEAGKETEPAKPTTAVPQAPQSKGLAEEGNNPKLVELVAAFETCKLTSSNPKWDCREAIKPFMAVVDKAADAPTLFNFLDDTNPHVRIAAANAISSTMIMQTAAGREFGARLLGAAMRETEAIMAPLLGDAILQGDFEDEAYSAGVESIVTTHPLAEMRAAVVANLPVQDWDRFFPLLTKRLAEDESPVVREAIMASFYTSAGKPGACDFFAANLNDADAKVAAKAAYNIVWTSDACASKYDDFINHFEERIKAGKVDFMYLNSTNYMAQSKTATEEQKAKYFGLLKTIVEDTKVAAMARASALTNLGKYAPDGKATAKAFLKDDEQFVKDAAKAVVSGK